MCVCACVIHEASQVLPVLPDKVGSYLCVCFLYVVVVVVCVCVVCVMVCVCACACACGVSVCVYPDINPTPVSTW